MRRTPGALGPVAGVALALSAPYWLPSAVVALRVKVFARVNGPEGVIVPNEQVGPDRFEELYGHPAANGRSRGAGLSDLFWYWLSPGPEVHQEHLEPGPRYDAVARTTTAILAGSSARLSAAATRCAAAVLDELVPGDVTLVRLRDLMMPVWAEFFHELVFHEPCPPGVRELITGNAADVVDSLKNTRLRHMARRRRLTRYLLRRLAAGDLPHALPAELASPLERAHYLQGAFFNTAVVQMSEAMAHLLLVLATEQDVQRRLAARPEDDHDLGNVMNETLRMYPLFGIAHRITTADIDLGDGVAYPAGTVLCFDYPAYHASGHENPEVFDPGRWDRVSMRDAHHIPFGIAANRPCPAWRLAPLVMRAVTREMLRRFTLHSSVSHTRSIPHRAPCLLVARDRPLPRHRLIAVLGFMRLRDRWEDLGRSVLQLVLGTWMVRDARRLRLTQRYFAQQDAAAARAAGRPRPAAAPGAAADGRPPGASGGCPYPHG
ncbi:cytochrome P450 [Actinacidiphila sp. DG2A-62]|uniref:cytochrome P450 n=1 Tax=Actinacidiphila sp. DG2A-62 TaxID=3108821 RepID=UPI002DB749E8|nr:cytochrome P450 [Actinacidiphila sp. DG2A-62]MEC3992194.1 cytochrome P450 [Actinacidiphila sp. DG2A-62]